MRPLRLNGPCELGSLEDLRTAGKGGQDPNGRGSTVVATNVLWSDPVATPGLEPNTCRGVGVTFGPDVTQVGARLDEWKLWVTFSLNVLGETTVSAL